MKPAAGGRSKVEILSYHMIRQFSYDGTFLNQLHMDIPAFSFVHANDFYWFYTGNNHAYSPYRLFRTDHTFTSVRNYLTDHSNMLPLTDTNFGQGAGVTFRESLYNKIYRITGDSLVLSYTIKFPGMEIPSAIHEMQPMEVVEYLKQSHYASIRCYLENQAYTYLLILENKSDEPPLFYHWIIDKNNRRETIIKSEMIRDSYLLSPQLLTEDNQLHFIGYPVENENEQVNPELNPSIVIVDISGDI
jgi:hypothetical protein